MSKFKVGDRVRFVNNTGMQEWAEGIEFTVGKYHEDHFRNSSGWYDGHDATKDGEQFAYLNTPGYSGGVWEENLELVPTIEDEIERVKSLLEDLEQQLEDAKPKAEKLPSGTVVKIPEHMSPGYMSPGYMVKLTKDAWATLDKESKVSRFDNINVVRDLTINDWGFEVIREGI